MSDTTATVVEEIRYLPMQVRALDTTKREATGIAVPWNTEALIRGMFEDYIEEFERGAVQDSDGALIFWRHDEPVGKVTVARDVDAGWEITFRLSDTPRGNEAYQLLKDEVITELSIGFVPLEWREETTADPDVMKRIRTKVTVREVSLVPFGAYGQAATVSQVRERTQPTKTKEPTMEPDTITRADLEEVRSSIEEIDRKVAVGLERDTTPRLDTRTAGEVLKAIVAGDDTAIREYNDLQRVYTGGVLADAVDKPAWVGDLTRIFDASSSTLSDFFSTGTLPTTGSTLEYAELASNTIGVGELAEGVDMGFGKVGITTKNATVKTYAGGTELTRMEIERASVNVLTTSLEALATAAGARKKANMRAAWVALLTARKAIAVDAGVVVLGATLAAATASNWEDALINAAIKFEGENLTLDGMFVSGSVFKKLRSLTVAGERVFQTYKDNASGVLNLPGLTGEFAGLQVRLDTGQVGDEAAFANARAIRSYDSALVSLQDENIVNLSKSFAVYRYGAVAAEIPAGVVPVKLTA